MDISQDKAVAGRPITREESDSSKIERRQIKKKEGDGMQVETGWVVRLISTGVVVKNGGKIEFFLKHQDLDKGIKLYESALKQPCEEQAAILLRVESGDPQLEEKEKENEG